MGANSSAPAAPWDCCSAQRKKRLIDADCSNDTRTKRFCAAPETGEISTETGAMLSPPLQKGGSTHTYRVPYIPELHARI